tara:strand:- start:149 stop:556 length:408 start_codon:yes stop_codon:yes gene_type:complete
MSDKSICVDALKKDNAELTKWNYDLMKKYKVKTSDPIINNVINRIFKRHLEGMEKFKKTMADNPKSISEWIEDIIEEQIDSICYLVTLKSRYNKEVFDLLKENDLLRDDLQIVNLENGRMMEKINRLKNHGKNKT